MVGLTGCKSGSGECKMGDVMKAMAEHSQNRQKWLISGSQPKLVLHHCH